MGVDLVYSIEFKDRQTKNKWNLVKILVPLEQYGYTKYQAHCTQLGGKDFFEKYEDSTRGVVRDMLSVNNWYDFDVDSKGFPDDISDELKQIHDDDDDMSYCYGMSYMTLTELNALYKESLNKGLTEYNNSNVEQQFQYLNKRFDRIEALIKQNKVSSLKSFKMKNKFDIDNPDENESLWDALWFGQWIQGIKSIAEFYSGVWLDDNDVRIIYYFC